MSMKARMAGTLVFASLFSVAGEGDKVSVRFGGRLVVPAFQTMLEPKAADGDWCFNGGAGGFESE